MELERWRKRLIDMMQQELSNDDDEDAMTNILLLQGLSAAVVSKRMRGPHGGSRPGRRANVERGRQVGQERIWRDYFAQSPVHDDRMFRRRYRMRRSLFLRIMNSVTAHDDFFVQRRDACGQPGLPPLQKCTAAIRVLVGRRGLADACDEYCRLGESTAMLCLKKFVRAVREVFEGRYLRQPTAADVRCQMENNAARGFPGMFASLDCMYYDWKNWKKDRNNAIILEAIVDKRSWIWHCHFGLPGGKNDLSLVDRSPVVANMLSVAANEFKFSVNGVEYPRYYLLTDDTYPRWSVFVQTIHEPQVEKNCLFAEMHEACRRDVERCFGVLQSRFAVIQNPSRLWDKEVVRDIMYACVILHNMIIEDEQDLNLEPCFDEQIVQLRRGESFALETQGTEDIDDLGRHFSLRNDLIEHLWALQGNSY